MRIYPERRETRSVEIVDGCCGGAPTPPPIPLPVSIPGHILGPARVPAAGTACSLAPETPDGQQLANCSLRLLRRDRCLHRRADRAAEAARERFTRPVGSVVPHPSRQREHRCTAARCCISRGGRCTWHVSTQHGLPMFIGMLFPFSSAASWPTQSSLVRN